MKFKLFSKKNIIVLLSVIVVAYLGYLIFNVVEQRANLGVVSQDVDSWNVYKNEKYGFSVSYPRGWKVSEDFTTAEPKINIYKTDLKSKPPYDHFSDVSNVSFFPLGLGTEGVIGKSRDSQAKINYETQKSYDYLTKNGEVWATYLNLKDAPENWKDWGFIWVKNKINNPVFSCSRDGAEISIEECNPYDGDEFERSGVVDPEIQKIQEKILASFKILK